MNTIEDRISAALHARADLVQPEDLRAPELPTLAPTSRWRRPAVYGLLAAACAAAIAVPILVGNQTADVRDPEPAPPGPTGDNSPKVGGPIELAPLGLVEVGEEWQVELDGGGLDTVSLEGPAAKEYYEAGDVSLVVTTTTGGTQEVMLAGVGYLSLLKGTVAGPDLPALVVSQTEGGDFGTYAVYGFVDGELVELTNQVTEPQLVTIPGGAEWTDTSLTTDDRLVTFQGTSDDPETADVWQWSIDGSELTVTDLGRYCRKGGSRWAPCR